MFLSETLNLGAVRAPTFLIIGFLGFIFWLFILWYESKKDGFETERFLDLVFMSVILSGGVFLVLRRVYDYLKIYRPTTILLYVDDYLVTSVFTFLSSLLPVFIVAKKRKWSKYRIFDIYSLAFGFFIIFLSTGRFFVYGEYEFAALALLTLIFYFGVLRFRGYKFVSGLIFSLFLVFISLMIFALFKVKGNLLFCLLLVMIALENLYFRRKRYMQQKRNLPLDFLRLVKSKLIAKEKELSDEQQLLITEDPYKDLSRVEDNSEYMDEAILEDQRKQINDNRINVVKSMTLQVRKALAALKIGRYGTCEVCGKPIDPARLRVYPEATTCLDHADKN